MSAHGALAAQVESGYVADGPVARPSSSSTRLARGRVARTLRDHLLVVAALVSVWHAAAAVTDDYWLPSPRVTFSRVAGDLVSASVVEHAAVTLAEGVAGLAAGTAPAVGLALLLRRRVLATSVLEPFMMAGYGLPKVILTPLFILWFGVGLGPKIAVVALSAFFVVYVNTLAGLRGIDVRLVKTARVLGATPREVVLRIVLPSAMPFVMTGVRTAVPYSIGGAVLAELLSANRGLGYLLQFNATSFDTAGVFSVLVIIGAVVAVLNAVVNAIERRWIRPHAAR